MLWICVYETCFNYHNLSLWMRSYAPHDGSIKWIYLQSMKRGFGNEWKPTKRFENNNNNHNGSTLAHITISVIFFLTWIRVLLLVTFQPIFEGILCSDLVCWIFTHRFSSLISFFVVVVQIVHCGIQFRSLGPEFQNFCGFFFCIFFLFCSKHASYRWQKRVAKFPF